MGDEEEPLLPWRNARANQTLYVFIVLLKWVLKIVMWLVFMAWLSLIFLYPLNVVDEFVKKWTTFTNATFLGISGGMFLIFSGPILIITFLSIPYLIISDYQEKFNRKRKKKRTKIASYKLGTFPVVVDGPLGVVCVAEFIWIILLLVYIIWAVCVQTLRNLTVTRDSHSTHQQQIYMMLELSGLSMGSIGIFCLAFLFLPIARGSLLLQLIDIPFEHAVRYHIWLGHLTMLLFTFHGLFYVSAWTMEGRLLNKILEWENTHIANLAGVISLIIGFLMWVTTLHPVRNKSFELFFYTHQLYSIFIIFVALHTSDYFFGIATGGIFLFMLDRFLRFCQSQNTVDIISATYLPCGTIKFIISKSKNLHYNALSFVFLKVKEISWLQWHPFSVSSSPEDGESHLSILVKVCGEWTMKLKEYIFNNHSISRVESQNSQLTAFVEGPYGHKVSYHLMYENLILIASGIGISPFLAILNDILYHVKNNKHLVPRNVFIVWAMKRSNELDLLSTIDIGCLLSSRLSDELIKLEIVVHVTRESEPASPSEESEMTSKPMSAFVYNNNNNRNRCGISFLVGTGHKTWVGLYIMLSTVGFVLLEGLINNFYIKPSIIPLGWYSGLLFIISMSASVLTFGGLVVWLWHLCERKNSTHEEDCDIARTKINMPICYETKELLKDACQEKLADFITIRYGSRPNFKDYFALISESWGHVDVGVMVCGPPSLRSSVAKECKSFNIWRQRHHPIFHYHSHSFEL